MLTLFVVGPFLYFTLQCQTVLKAVPCAEYRFFKHEYSYSITVAWGNKLSELTDFHRH